MDPAASQELASRPHRAQGARTVTLRGITWSHSRGYLPMVATAQRYAEIHPEAEVLWERRSLKDFEEVPIERLAQTHDLIVIDHPFIGYAAANRIFLPLDDWMPGDFVSGLEQHSVGKSYESYRFEGRLWALPIDAAAPVAAWRQDLLERKGFPVPRSVPEVLELARAGHLEIPGAPINCLMNFLGLCASLGDEPFRGPVHVVGHDAGARALGLVRALHRSSGEASMTRNPIQSLELMASGSNEEKAYCLFPYGYSNYSRRGYAENLLQFGDLPSLEAGGRALTTTLGGTGLAVSAKTQHAAEAADYARFVASPEIQSTLYVQSGGQPAHRPAWLDPDTNRLAQGYFAATLPALERAYLRPRYPGYTHGFQELAGPAVHRHVVGSADERETLGELDRLFAASRRHA